MKRLPTIPIPPPIKGINRFTENDPQTAAEALDIYTENTFEVRRRPSFQCLTTGPGVRLPPGNNNVLTQSLGGSFTNYSSTHIPTSFSSVAYVYVGGASKFNAIWWGEVIGYASASSITASATATVELYTGGTWTEAAIVDKTKVSFSNSNGVFVRSLLQTGNISWHEEDPAYSAWTLGTFSSLLSYWARISIPSDALLPTLTTPGVSIVNLKPVTTVIPAVNQRLIIADDNNEDKRKRLGASMGVIASTWKTPRQAMLTSQVGGCFIENFTSADVLEVSVATLTGREWAYGANLTAPAWDTPITLGTNNELTKTDQTFDWNDDTDATLNSADQWRGGPVVIDLTLTGGSTTVAQFDSLLVTLGTNELEGCFLQRLADGEERQITSNTSTTITVYPAFSSTLVAAEVMRVNRPNAWVQLRSIDARFYVQSNTANTLAFPNYNLAPSSSINGLFAINGDVDTDFFRLGWEFPWKFAAGDFWSYCVDPFSGHLLLANGKSGIVRFNGETFTDYVPWSDLENPSVQNALGILNSTDDPDRISETNAANQLLKRVPLCKYLAVFDTCLIAADEHRVYWSLPWAGSSIWPKTNYADIKDADNSPITTIQTLGDRLIVSTATTLFASGPMNEDNRLQFSQESQGFGILSHQATAKLVFNGSPAIVGPTSQGIIAHNGNGEPVYVLDRWDRVLKGGVNTARLKFSVGMFSKARNEYFIAVTPSGEDTNTRIIVWNLTNNTFWVWSAPFGGVTAMCSDQQETGEETLYFGFNDGHVGTLNDALTDDGLDLDINAEFTTHPQTPDPLTFFNPVAIELQTNPATVIETGLIVNRRGTAFNSTTNTLDDGESVFGTGLFGTATFGGKTRVTRQVKVPVGNKAQTVQLKMGGVKRWHFYGAQILYAPGTFDIKGTSS